MSRSIFTPIQIKSMVCPNRILRSATWEALSDKDGFMSKNSLIFTVNLQETTLG